jgi:hypothetical protein
MVQVFQQVGPALRKVESEVIVLHRAHAQFGLFAKTGVWGVGFEFF